MSLSRLIATFFGAGLLSPAPGTWGSLAALPVLWLLHVLGGFWLVAAATLAVAGLGWWATLQETGGALDADPGEIVIDEVVGMWIALWPVSLGASMQETGGALDADPGEIVIDEVVGMWIALWPVSLGAMMQGVDVLRLWPGWVVGFLAFRLFDIWKVGPVGWAERQGGPLGVMLDDVVAGLMAAVVVVLAAAVAHIGFRV